MPPTDKAGRIPELEGTRTNAEYWAREARKLHVGHAEKQLCMEQAVNAWKNAAYAAWDKINASRSAERATNATGPRATIVPATNAARPWPDSNACEPEVSGGTSGVAPASSERAQEGATPRTDAEEHRVNYVGPEGECDYMAVSADFARKLEREIAEADEWTRKWKRIAMQDAPRSATSAHKACPYCTSDNEAIRSTYYDQTCEGCVKRMGKP
jgi:hypothetical protein